MKIGIIGAGNIGQAAASRLLAAGHEIVISNSRGPRASRSSCPRSDLPPRLAPPSRLRALARWS